MDGDRCRDTTLAEDRLMTNGRRLRVGRAGLGDGWLACSRSPVASPLFHKSRRLVRGLNEKGAQGGSEADLPVIAALPPGAVT